MTRAPANLLAVRTLLLTHLDNAPGPDDLDPAEVGIVGDPAHRGGYHCGSDRVVTNDYSVVESSRDRAGLTLDAAALDVGWFEWEDKQGKVHNLYTFNRWMVGECERNAPDTLDIREIIYTLDGTTVKRWDRLRKRKTGDSSHRWHTHFSFFRDAIKAGRDQRSLFRRYLQSIGLIKSEDDMTPEEHQWLADVRYATVKLDGRTPTGQAYLRTVVGKDDSEGAKPVSHPTLTSLDSRLKVMQAALGALTGKDLTEELEALRQAEEQRHAELMAAVGNVDVEVIEALGADDREPAEVAALLRAALGDRADAVFQAGLGQD